MKVDGTGQPPAPNIPGSEPSDKAAKPNDTTGPRESSEPGKSFSEKLAGAGPVEKTRLSEASTVAHASRTGDVAVNDVAANLQAGKLTPEAAVDQVLERVVARQVGPDAPPAVRDQVRVALRNAIESDPFLAAKLDRLR